MVGASSVPFLALVWNLLTFGGRCVCPVAQKPTDGRKAPAVVPRDTKPAQRLAMGGGAITHITLPAITGMFTGKALHDLVTLMFGDDRGGGNAEAARIPFHHRLGGA